MEKSEEQIDKELDIIEKLYELQEKLAVHFSNKSSYTISRLKIFNALFLRLSDKYNLERQGDLWDLDLKYDEALELLSDFDFKIFESELTSKRNILPKDFLME